VLRVVDAVSGDELTTWRELCAEYAQMPHIAGRWDTWAADIANLPGPCVPPLGAMLLALLDERPVACVAMAPLDPPRFAELKRLYVRADARGHGVGEALTREVIRVAIAGGYGALRLDTAPELLAAQALYRRLGFREIPRYRWYGEADSVCFESSLR